MPIWISWQFIFAFIYNIRAIREFNNYKRMGHICNVAQAMRCDYVESAADEREPHKKCRMLYMCKCICTLHRVVSVLCAGIFEFQTHKWWHFCRNFTHYTQYMWLSLSIALLVYVSFNLPLSTSIQWLTSIEFIGAVKPTTTTTMVAEAAAIIWILLKCCVNFHCKFSLIEFAYYTLCRCCMLTEYQTIRWLELSESGIQIDCNVLRYIFES